MILPFRADATVRSAIAIHCYSLFDQYLIPILVSTTGIQYPLRLDDPQEDLHGTLVVHVTTRMMVWK